MGTLVAMLMPESAPGKRVDGRCQRPCCRCGLRGAAQDVAWRAQHVVDEVAPEVQRPSRSRTR
ncbi:MAG: hypothetical protein R2854_04110 [Caldilineaceae bacterium]